MLSEKQQQNQERERRYCGKLLASQLLNQLSESEVFLHLLLSNIRGIGISSSSIELLLTESCPSSTPPAKVALILLFFDPRDESPMLTELVWRKKEKRSSPRHDGSILRIFFLEGIQLIAATIKVLYRM